MKQVIQRAYKTELDPTQEQIHLFYQCAGFARFVFNYGLAQRIEAYQERGESLNYYGQRKAFVETRKNTPEWAWMDDLSYSIYEFALRDLDASYQNFFRRVKTGEKPGFPKFKGKKNSPVRFRIRDGVTISEDSVRLPKIGWIRLKERGYIPTDGIHILSATVSLRAGHWFVSVQCEQEIEVKAAKGAPVGVDVGVKALAVVSDGKHDVAYENPKALAAYEKRLRRLQRKLCRQQKGGANREKTKQAIAKTHYKIECIRKHALHNASAAIVGKDEPARKRPRVIVVEDLNVKGMVRNHSLAKAISDASMSELHRQLAYKAAWNGSEVVEADRFYPSTQTCSHCGTIQEVKVTLDVRTFKCSECGFVLDRDANAARNLARLA